MTSSISTAFVFGLDFALHVPLHKVLLLLLVLNLLAIVINGLLHVSLKVEVVLIEIQKLLLLLLSEVISQQKVLVLLELA